MKLIASGEFTRSDLYSACAALSRTRTLIAFAAIGLVVLAAGLTGLLWGANSDNPMITIFPTLLGGAWFTLPWWQPYLAAKQMQKGSNFRGRIEYEFKDSGVRSALPSMTTEWQWSSFVRWKNAPRTLLLYISPNCALFVPKRFLSSPADLVQVESLLRQNIGEPVR